MSKFVKFSEVKKQRAQMAQEAMAEIKGGIANTNPFVIYCNPATCKYLVSKYAVCPYNYSCRQISMYGVRPSDPYLQEEPIQNLEK